jgi:alpha/beta hydrolase fold
MNPALRMSLLARNAVALFAALLLVLPTSAVHADGTYQTPNGQRTVAQMADELHRVAYPGPWDDSSVVAAYLRTAAVPESVGVMVVGGLGSTPDESNWSQLWQTLGGSVARYTFAYTGGGWAANPEAEQRASCQSPATSKGELAAWLRLIRAAHEVDHVSLVGHSLGGVLVVDTLIENPDLVPFVNTVVAVDSPFGGITEWSWVTFGFKCQSANELMERRAVAVQGWYDTYLPALLNRGLTVRAIVNTLDGRIGTEYQCICDQSVNWYVSADGHSAALYDPSIVGLIAKTLAHT